MKMTEGEFNRLVKSLSEVKLSETNKQKMLSGIYAAGNAEPEKPVSSPFVFSYYFSSQRLVATFAVFMFMLVGTGYAAGQSLPGQLLYGIKVKFLEPAVLELTWNEEDKNGYKIHLLQTRVAEMRSLQTEAGINLEAEEASYYATERNVGDLETSAIFSREGANVQVSTEVETYNSLISEPFHIETKLLKKKAPVEEEEEKEEDEKDQVSKPIEKVADKVLEETEAATAAVQGVSATVTDTVEAVTKPVEEVAKPVNAILGL